MFLSATAPARMMDRGAILIQTDNLVKIGGREKPLQWFSIRLNGDRIDGTGSIREKTGQSPHREARLSKKVGVKRKLPNIVRTKRNKRPAFWFMSSVSGWFIRLSS
jgi:hypothetical protein